MANSPIQIDQLIIPRWLVPVDESESVLERYALAIKSDRIVAMDKVANIYQKYQTQTEIRLDNHILLPGLVNAHTHAAMTLLRGFADDLPLNKWLNKHIWPAETAWVDAEFVKVGTDLALAEMIKSGTTCFSDMYFFPEVTAQRAERAGLRACVGMIVLDSANAWAKDAVECIDKGLQLRDSIRHTKLVTCCFAPHAPYTVSDRTFERIRILSDEMDLPMHMHIHETRVEINQSIKEFKMRPLKRLHQLGLLGPHLNAVHMVHLTTEEIEWVSDYQVTVVHCPQSNLKLASGLCPVAKLMEKEVQIAIGTDGASSNNDLDMLNEMQTAALLAKGVSENPQAMPAHAALTAATFGGANALGLGGQIGTLQVGKQADCIAVNLADCATLPIYQPLSQLVYAAARHQVSDVWVAGKRLLNNRQLTTLDEDEIMQKANEIGSKIAAAKSYRTTKIHQ